MYPHRQDLCTVHKTSTFKIQGTFGTAMRKMHSMTIKDAEAKFTSERTASDRFPVPKVSLKSATYRCKAYGISSLWRDLLAMNRDLEMPHFSQRDLERG